MKVWLKWGDGLKASGIGDVGDAHVGVLEQFPGAVHMAAGDVLGKAHAGGGFEPAAEVRLSDVRLGGGGTCAGHLVQILRDQRLGAGDARWVGDMPRGQTAPR